LNRPPHSRSSRPLARVAFALLVAPALLLSACGDWDYDGNVLVDNQTDAGVPEDVLAFRLARFGDPFTGNLLAAPLPPGSTEHLGAWHEDYYDAEADMQGGDLVEWFDTWIYADEDNYFDIF
jgi:hypothetical protein